MSFLEYHTIQSDHCQTSLTSLASSLAVSHSPLLLSAAPGTQIQWHRGPGPDSIIWQIWRHVDTEYIYFIYLARSVWGTSLIADLC